MEIGDYRLIASLGRGGMADVFLATRRGPAGFTKLVVIKRLRSDLASEPEADRYRALLLDEARLAARMHHPNIVQTFEVAEADGEPYMAMEYLDGQSLRQVVRAARRTGITLPTDIVVRVMVDVLAALEYAHGLADYDGTPMEIVHRDVSPENAFWTFDGDIKLVDFGVAKFALGSSQTEAGIVKGKAAYMAPEQARGEQIDRRVDVFAAGVVLWELIAGRRLFAAQNQAASLNRLLFESILPLDAVRPEISPVIASVCARALERDRDRRFPDARTMRAELEVAGATPRRETLAAFVQPMFDVQRRETSALIRSALQADAPLAALVQMPGSEDSTELSTPDAVPTVAAKLTTAARVSKPAIVLPDPKRRWVGAAVGSIALACGVAAVIVWTRHDAPAPTGSVASPPVPVVPANVLHLCGSNTIGADLAPALLDAFLRKKGATSIEHHAGAEPQQSEISAILDGTPLTIDLRARGTATAFDGLAAGACDVGMASRAIDDAEVARLDHAGFGDLRSPATEHVIALDGIAVIVHPNNPVRVLDRAALRDVFAGKARDWSQVGGSPGPITVYARDKQSGTYDTFKHLVLDDGDIVETSHRLAQSDTLADQVASDPSAIGFIGLAYIRSAKALAVADGGALPMMPTSFTVTTEDYMLSRRLYLYTTPRPRNPLVTELVSFALSPQGQAVVREASFVDLTVALRTPEPCDARCPARYAKLVANAQRASFDFRFRAGDQLDSRATRDLDRLVQLLRDHPGAKVLLIGFSDDTGNPDGESRALAQSIARELATRGITAEIDGFGSAMTIARGADRARNRRVEVWLRGP